MGEPCEEIICEQSWHREGIRGRVSHTTDDELTLKAGAYKHPLSGLMLITITIIIFFRLLSLEFQFLNPSIYAWHVRNPHIWLTSLPCVPCVVRGDTFCAALEIFFPLKTLIAVWCFTWMCVCVSSEISMNLYLWWWDRDWVHTTTLSLQFSGCLPLATYWNPSPRSPLSFTHFWSP